MAGDASFATITRRRLLVGSSLALAAGLAGCVSDPTPVQLPMAPQDQGADGMFGDPAVMYGPVLDGGYQVPAIPYQKINPIYYRQIVDDPTGEKPGTIVVSTPDRFLYLVQEDGAAIRYGVGIGREGFAWAGRGHVQWKQKWPKWTPPADMIARQPELAKYSAAKGGMAPGLDNPLGARAMYIFQGGKDTLYRIHGSPEWWSIGKAVSSGCIRLIDQDVIDLYGRVPVGTPVLVIGPDAVG